MRWQARRNRCASPANCAGWPMIRPAGATNWFRRVPRRRMIARRRFRVVPCSSPDRYFALPRPPAVRRAQLTPADDAAGRKAIADCVDGGPAQPRRWLGRVRRVNRNMPFMPVADPMRSGGMAVACLAVVSDAPTHRIGPDRRIHPFRDPEPGELYDFGNRAFERVHALVREQGLRLVDDRVRTP